MTARYPRPPILDRIPLDRHTVMEASAGTGKTFTLEHLVVELLLRGGVTLDQILVVTFTDKATRQMRARVRATLGALLSAGSADVEGPAWEIDARARAALERAAATFDRAPISTIHAFCHRVLSEHAFESQRLFELEQVEPRQAFGRAFREVLRERLGGSGRAGALLELALSRGTPARLESALFDWYSERGRPGPSWDPAAFARALGAVPGVGAMEAARPGIRAGVRQSRQVETIVRRLVALAEIAERFRTDGDEATALADCAAWRAGKVSGRRVEAYLAEHLGRAARFAPAVGPLAAAVAEVVGSTVPPTAALVHELLPEVRDRLAARKRALGQLDFDDMLVLVRDALRADGGDALLAHLRRRYRCALVDEFQDTDAVQWEIFRRVFVDSGQGHTLFLIGDPKQAIYGFRNADVHTYRAARRAIADGGGEVVPLRDNHRSSAAMIDAYNLVFDELFTGDDGYPEPVRCGQPRRAALSPTGEEVPPVGLVSLPGEASAAERRAALCRFVAREIEALLAGSLRVREADGVVRGLVPSDVHVLTRTADEGYEVGAALRARGLPYAYFKQEGLFQTAEAHHVRDVLAAVVDPRDRSRRMRAWLTPFFDVPLEELERARDLDPSHPLLRRLHAWSELAGSYQYARLFRAMVEGSGLSRRELFRRRSERELTNYEHVLEVLLEEAHRKRQSLAELLAKLRAFIDGRAFAPGLDGNVQRLESEAEAVQILTMHKAKGLEAHVVFLCGAMADPPSRPDEPRVHHVDGERRAWLGPAPEAIEERIAAEAREETERLLYVALTRPRSRIYLPFVEEGHTVRGPIRPLVERLRALDRRGALDPARFARMRPPELAAPHDAVAGGDPLAGLTLPDLGAVDGDDGPWEALRRERAGWVVTSYTRIKSERDEPYRAPDAEDRALLGDGVDTALEPGPDELPGGAATGVFLHEVLEHVPFVAALEAGSPGAFFDREDVRAVLDARADAHGVLPRHRAHAARLVFDALRAPIACGRLDLPGGLATVARRVAEMSLLYPIPEEAHPPPTAAPGAPLEIGRGFVRGVVDLVFEHGGRVYFLDWKSDRLPSFAAEAIARHVDASYALQARLYTLGVTRAFGLTTEAEYEARFGGLLYVFLRGMPGAISFARPSHAELLSWEAELRVADLGGRR